MKRTITGMEAYAKMVSVALPAKTDTYTPISHASVVSRMRTEITKAGFIISDESYRCTNDGQVALGTLRINYKSDPDIQLAANFTNSYNKQLAFRFSLGGVVKVCMNGMIISNEKFGSYKRIHKGSADILAEGKISDFINDADEYWETLVRHKDKMKDIYVSESDKFFILGDLFYNKELLNTMQLNVIRNEIKKPSFTYGTDADSAWSLYNHITLALKETHPTTWMEDQGVLHELFDEIFDLSEAFATEETKVEEVDDEVNDEISDEVSDEIE